LEEAADIFRVTFGFASSSFIAPSYIWDSVIEKTLRNVGVKYIQGISYQYIPNPGNPWYRRKFHYTGQSNSLGQHYLVRNAFFEPTLIPDADTVGECMRRIALAFKWGKPAIIGSHRVNFIGSLNEANRNKNLILLRELLNRICSNWPDVEFLSSDQLGDQLTNQN